MTVSVSTAARNAKLDALVAFMGASPLLRVYNGTLPAGVNSAIGVNTKLAELVMAATPFPAAVSGSITANAITGDASADATGTATFYRIYKADGITAVVQGAVGLTSTDLVLNTTSIITASPVSVISLVYTEGNP